MRKPVRLIVLLLGMILCGCQREQVVTDLPIITVRIGDRDFQLEVAATDPARQKGLMQRDSMPSDHGMLFVFPSEERRSFWMKNTRIPLDIIFLDAAGKVDSIKSMKPYDLSSTFSDGPAKYAIELNQGKATAAGVTKGSIIDLPPEVRESPQ